MNTHARIKTKKFEKLKISYIQKGMILKISVLKYTETETACILSKI
jgi:hypothetical protein